MATTAAGKKRMTQSDVINYFAERTGMKRAQVKQLFEDLATLATNEVKSNGEFVLPGFCYSTGDEIDIFTAFHFQMLFWAEREPTKNR